MIYAEISISEERWLFYVAITRALMMIFILYDSRHLSDFVTELHKGESMQRHALDVRKDISPAIKMVSPNGSTYPYYRCLNWESGCYYSKIVFDD